MIREPLIENPFMMFIINVRQLLHLLNVLDNTQLFINFYRYYQQTLPNVSPKIHQEKWVCSIIKKILKTIQSYDLEKHDFDIFLIYSVLSY